MRGDGRDGGDAEGMEETGWKGTKGWRDTGLEEADGTQGSAGSLPWA